MKKQFEYRTEYVAIPFKTETSGKWIFKAVEETLEPDVGTLAHEGTLQSILNELGAQGWELVSTQPVCRAEIKVANQNAQGWSYGFAMPVGFILFMRRQWLPVQANSTCQNPRQINA